MKHVFRLLVFSITFSVAVAGEKIPDKAMCAVCVVQGETEEEKVRAHAKHDSKMYYFCNERCKGEFLAEPIWYVVPELPRPAPTFVVESLDGDDVASTFEGKVTLVDFWATWCKPCEKIMPELQRLSTAYADQGFQVMGISIDDKDDRIERINKFLKKHKITYPVYSDAKNQPAWYTYRVRAVPAMFLVDRDGQVVAEWRGSVDHDVLAQQVEKLVKADPKEKTKTDS